MAQYVAPQIRVDPSDVLHGRVLQREQPGLFTGIGNFQGIHIARTGGNAGVLIAFTVECADFPV